jgi:membrane associated rhomboid family serine protease
VRDMSYERVVVSIFLHKDFIQFFMNILCLLLYGFVVEHHYGATKFLIVFLTTAIIGIKH